jgi:hypothetical protein
MSKINILLSVVVLLILSFFLSCHLTETEDSLQLTGEVIITDPDTRSCVNVNVSWDVPYSETFGSVKYYDYYSLVYFEWKNSPYSPDLLTEISGGGIKRYKHNSCIDTKGYPYQIKIKVYARCYTYSGGYTECGGYLRETIIKY